MNVFSCCRSTSWVSRSWLVVSNEANSDVRLREAMDPANQSLADALRLSFRLLQVGILALLAVFLFSGFQTVEEGDVGVRTRFGAIVGDQGLEQIGPYGKACLAAQSAHPVLGIVPGEGGQVNAGNGLEEPGSLVGFLDRAPARQGLAPALDGGGVGLDRKCPIEVKVRSRVPWVLVRMRGLTHCSNDRETIFRIRPLSGKGRVFNVFVSRSPLSSFQSPPFSAN